MIPKDRESIINLYMHVSARERMKERETLSTRVIKDIVTHIPAIIAAGISLLPPSLLLQGLSWLDLYVELDAVTEARDENPH